MKKLWVIGCLLALFGFGTAAAGESMFGVPWSYRVRKGAQGAVKIAADGISVRRDNADGEIVALSNKGFPVEPGAIYRVSYRLIGPKNGEVTPQAPIPGRRPFPSAGRVKTIGEMQTINVDVSVGPAEKTLSATIYFSKPGEYKVNAVTLEKLAAAKSADELVNERWGNRVRQGALGSVVAEARQIVIRRDNSDGEILTLCPKPYEVEPGATYRVEVRLTGPENGEFILQAPISGRRPFPSAGRIRTTGKEQQAAFEVAMRPGEKALSIVMYFTKPGVYRVSSVKLTKVGAPLKAQTLRTDAELLIGNWRNGFNGSSAGEFRRERDGLRVEVFDTFGSGVSELLDRVTVRPETRYRLAVESVGSGKISVDMTIFGADGPRKRRFGYLACNGNWETLTYDFVTGKGDAAISFSFIYLLGKYQIRSVRLMETDPAHEFAEDQKDFMVIWRSGKRPKADPVFSRDFKFASGRFSGRLAVLLEKAFPERKLKFESGYLPEDNVRAEIVVRDLNKRELLRAPANASGVLLPEQAAFTYLELTAPASGAPYRPFTVRDDITAPEAFHWRQWNSYEVGNPDKRPTLYRTKFTLDQLPVGAIGRFLTSGRIAVNGRDFGHGVTGDSSSCYHNLLPALKVGENEITVDMPNPKYQGMQTDILLGFADGSHRVMRGDDGTWEMREKDAAEWKKVPVLKSTFRKMHFSQRWISPGEMPDSVVPKVNFTGKAEFAATGLRGRKRLPVALEMEIKDWMFLGANRFDLSIVDASGKRCWRQTVWGGKDRDFVKGFKGKLKLNLDLCTEFLAPGTYHLETPEFLRGRIAGEFSVIEGCRPKVDFAVDYRGYLPMFKVNGQLYPVAIYRHLSRFKIGHENYFLHDFWRGMRQDGDVKFHIANAEMGPDAHKNAGVCSGEMWTGPGQYNFGILDRMLENILAVDPDSLILLSVNIDAPQWYLKTYPGTRAVWHTGELSGGVSWASAQWRRDSVAAAQAMMAYVASKPYASRIVGVFFSGGYDGQWFHHLSWRQFPYKVTDYHPEMLAAFRAYLRRIYANDDRKLQAAWHDRNVTFDTAQIPTFAERRGQGYYLDPAKGERRVIDFMDAQAEVLKTHLEELFAAAKSRNPHIIAGSYYLPHWDCSYRWGQTQRQMSDAMFDSPLYDFGAAPMDYTWRNIDEVGHTRFGRYQYYHVNRKLELLEDDNRTFKFAQMPILSWGNYTPPDCVNTMRRNYAQRLSLGAGVWYYDIFGSFFDTPLLLRIIREEQILWRASNEFPAVPELNAQATILHRIGNFNHRRMTRNADLTQTHYWRRLERYGYPVDQSMLRDLGNPRQPKYKLYLIDDIIALTPAERQKIDALKKDGNVLVFHHATGYSDWKSISAANISALTGINIVEDCPGVDLSDLAWRFADTRHPLLRGLNGQVVLRPKEYQAKRFAVRDPQAVPLGHFTDGGQVAAAVKQFPNWTAVYLPTLLPPFALQDNLAKFAGIHVFTDTSAAFRAGGRFISVYCLDDQSAGTVTLPKKFALYDVFADKVIPPVDRVDFALRQGDTKLWFVGTFDEVERFAKMVRKAGF